MQLLVFGVLARKSSPANILLVGMLVWFSVVPAFPSTEAISRELSLFNFSSIPDAQEISREVSIFNTASAPNTFEVVSREVSIFNYQQSVTSVEAISREWSVMNLGMDRTQWEASSREVSVFNWESAATFDGVSREWSVFNALDPVIVSLAGGPLRAGLDAALPIDLVSTLPLTNVDFTIEMPPGAMNGFSLETLSPQVCSGTLSPVSDGVLRLSLGACPNQSLVGTQRVALLHLTVVSNEVSSFVWPRLTSMAASDAFGFPPIGFVPAPQRIVIVAEEPLLECVLSAMSQLSLTLYGKEAPGYWLESSTDLTSASWTPLRSNFSMTNLALDILLEDPPMPNNFYRARRAE